MLCVAQSRFFPGLRLHIAALLQDDLVTVLAELQAGMDAARGEQPPA